MTAAGQGAPDRAAVLAAGVRARDVRAAAQLMRALDDGAPHAVEALRVLYPHTGAAAIVGVTGTPGAGKSTLVDELLVRLRRRGERVGVVAVDPSSPFTGGAILGDRIRMQRHALDPGVFIRSLATRGQMGGLSRSTADVVTVLDAFGCATVFVETVGVGQDEIDVMKVADTVVVVTLPGLGDEVQALKAGLLETADIFVVNKADREGVDRAVRDLTMMLELRRRAPGVDVDPEIIQTVAARGEGIDSLLTALDRHRDRQWAAGGFLTRRRAQAEARLRTLLVDDLRRTVDQHIASLGGLGRWADEVATRRQDPYSAAQEILASGRRA